MEKTVFIEGLAELDIDSIKNYEYLYHGTFTEDGQCDFFDIENINTERGKFRVDFGKGFYLTPLSDQAKRRAIMKCQEKDYSSTWNNKSFASKLPGKKGNHSKKKPIILKYPFDTSLIESLKLKIFQLPTLEWLEFIFNNRSTIVDDTENHNLDRKFDVVYGHMADGLFNEILQLFKKKFKDLTEEEMQLIYSTFVARGKQTDLQVSLHVKKAITMLLNNGSIIEVRGVS